MNTYSIMTIVLSLIQSSGASESWIVGGKVAKPHSRKYMASLQFWDAKWQHYCGGFLIRNDFVLTAAHCRLREMPMTVVLGAHNLREEEPSQQRIQIEEYFQHPNYEEYDFDIMLLKLKQKAKLNKFVKVINLPTKEKNTPALTECLVPGWGRTQPSKNSPSSNVLKEAVEKIQFNLECKNILQDYFNSEHMICTKFNTTKNGSMCQGDSGGPLICNGKPLGIVAYTHRDDCTKSTYPHVFTKISSFLPWIKKVMGGLGNASEPSTLDSQQINIRFN